MASKDERQRESTQAAPGAQTPQSGSQPGSQSRETTQSPQRGSWLTPFAGELSPWEPSGFRRFFEDFDRMFDQMRRQFLGGEGGDVGQGRPGRAEEMGRMARVEVEDTPTELVVNAELPGLEPDDVHIECADDVLTIRGEKRDERKAEGSTFRSERRFFRQIPVPGGCDVEKANASFRNGLLQIRLPKTTQNVKQIPISREGGHRAA
jgi:HSP20 family protein